MASKLLLFNNALLLLGERKLASLTEKREPRRLLDDVWDGGAVKTCLEEADWNFAIRSVQIEYDPSLDPQFGFTRGFSKPDDWVRTTAVAGDEYFTLPFKAHQFADEAGYWWADLDTLYARFVSDGDTYGNDLTIWPESFTRYVEAYMAHRIAAKLTKSGQIQDRVEAEMVRRNKSAVAKDAINQGTTMPREGSWNRARRSRFGRRDGGKRGQLIG